MVILVLKCLTLLLEMWFLWYVAYQMWRDFSPKKLSREEKLALEEKRVDALLAEQELELERQIDSLPDNVKVNSSESYVIHFQENEVYDKAKSDRQWLLRRQWLLNTRKKTKSR